MTSHEKSMTPKVGWLAAKSTMFLIGDTSTHSWFGVSSQSCFLLGRVGFLRNISWKKMDERFERWSGKMRVHIIYFPFFAKKKRELFRGSQ